MFRWWKRRLDAKYQEGYDAAKQEDIVFIEDAVAAGAIMAYRECANGLRDAAKTGSAEAIAEVCRQIAKNANFP